MADQLAVQEPQQSTRMGPMELLQIALQHNAAIDVIERLAALQDKSLAREAEIEFNEAMNATQALIGRIAPDLTNPQTRSKYASYPALDRVIRPIYTKQGLTLSFNTEDSPLTEHVRVICYVSLRSFTRKYQVDMPADGKGAKGGDVMTKTHATGSAMQYGMRYLLKYIFNIAIGQDDDGNAASGGEPLGEDIVVTRLDGIANCNDVDELLRVYKAAYREANDAGDIAAMKAYISAKDKRKKELANANR